MEVGNIHVGECSESDIAQIIAIEQDAFPTPWSEQMFRSELASPISSLLVARQFREAGAAVIGYVVSWKVDDEVHLHNIAVRREWRRQGIGSLLLQEVSCCPRMKGANWMTLEVRRTNAAAQRLYEKFGFTIRGVRPGYYTDRGEDALILWADLRTMRPGEWGCQR